MARTSSSAASRRIIPLYSSQLQNARTATRRQRRNGNFPAPPSHNAGRPQAHALTINYLICFERLLPNRLPKEGSTFWFHLQSKGLIKENIEISQTDELYHMIHSLFEKLNGQEWVLYSGSSGSLRKVIHNVNNNLKYYFIFIFLRINLLILI